MSAFLTDIRLVFAGFLDSGLAQLSAEQPFAYDLATGAGGRGGHIQGGNRLDRPDVMLTEPGRTMEAFSSIQSHRSLLPLLAFRYAAPSKSILANNTDALTGGVVVATGQTGCTLNCSHGTYPDTPTGLGTAERDAVASSQPARVLTESPSADMVAKAENFRSVSNGIARFAPSPSLTSPSIQSVSEGSFRVEAEDYSSYFDTTPRNYGKAYRNDGVDIRADSRSSGGFKVVGTRRGEWLQYDISPQAGTYKIVLRASTNAKGARVKLSFGDVRIPFNLKSSKGLGRNRNFVAKRVKIAANTNTFRLNVRSRSVHLDYVKFKLKATSASGSGGLQGGENSDGGNNSGNNGAQGSGLGTLPQGSFDETFGYGLVDASAAVSYALGTAIATGITTSSGSNSESLNAMNVAAVWNAGFTGQGQTIAVLDTGVDIQHLDLAANIWTNSGEVAGDGIDNDGNGYVDDVNGYDFVDDDGNVSDDNGHGTHITGIVAGLRNSTGITGLAYNANIMPVRIFDRDGLGYVQDIVRGIQYAVDNGADAINLSLAVDYSDSSLRNAIKYAYDNDVVVVSAAGNYGGDRPLFPARYANLYGLAVGTIDSSNQYQSYSNKAGTTRLDYVVAPGKGIVSSAPGGGTSTRSGTSQSTAQVAGLAALIRSANPNLTAERVEELIVKTANPQAVYV